MAKAVKVKAADGSWIDLASANTDLSSYAYLPTTPIYGFKNVLINADFRINQRTFTSTTTDGTYGFDRWKMSNSGGTCTYSAQSFSPGNAIGGYEPVKYARIVTTGQSSSGDYAMLRQVIEDVRIFAGQQVTLSFWAKSASGTPSVAVELEQNFGSGGSPSSAVTTYAGTAVISTSWTRYSITTTLPSISGKTIGTTVNTSNILVSLFTSAGSNWNSRTGSLGIQSNTIDFWGIQLELGSIATPFEQRPIAIEEMLCQRYYTVVTNVAFQGNVYASFIYPTSMRVMPTLTLTAGAPGGSGISRTGFHAISSGTTGFDFTASAEF